jgi:hypothetical protein
MSGRCKAVWIACVKRYFACIFSGVFLLLGCLYVVGVLFSFATQGDWNLTELDAVTYLSTPFLISTGLALSARINKKIKVVCVAISFVVLVTLCIFCLLESQKAQKLPNAILNADSARFKNYDYHIDRELNTKERIDFSKLISEINPRTHISMTALRFFTGASVCGCRGHGVITLSKDNKQDAYYFRHDEVLVGSFSFVQVDEKKVIEAITYLRTDH